MSEQTIRRRARRWRWLRRLALVPLAGAVALGVANMAGCFSGFGQSPSGPALDRLADSPNFQDHRFTNDRTRPTDQSFDWSDLKNMARRSARRPDRAPGGDIPVEAQPNQAFEPRWRGPGVRYTWVGHATVLLELDGFRVLTDPIWSQRCSPFSFAGPERLHRPGIDLETSLPEIDAVVISHDHYDHLDEHTVRALGARGDPLSGPAGGGLAPGGLGGDELPGDGLGGARGPDRPGRRRAGRRGDPGAPLLRAQTAEPEPDAVGLLGDPGPRATASGSAATPATMRASPRSASGSVPSI